MKKLILTFIFSVAIITLKAQQDTTKKEYLIKYEVLTKKGAQVAVGYFDKDGKNAGTIASENWTYSFATTDKFQNIQLYIQRAENGMKSIWVQVNIYVNEKLMKSVEDKFKITGPTVQVNLQDIK